MGYHYVTYEDAQILIPALESIKSGHGTTKDLRGLAGKFINELKMVREDVDYAPLKGHQIYFGSAKDSEVFSDILQWARGKEK